MLVGVSQLWGTPGCLYGGHCDAGTTLVTVRSPWCSGRVAPRSQAGPHRGGDTVSLARAGGHCGGHRKTGVQSPAPSVSPWWAGGGRALPEMAAEVAAAPLWEGLAGGPGTGTPQVHPWWSREPWGGTPSGVTCWGRVTASAAAILLPPTPPDHGTWGTPAVVAAGSQRGGARTLGTLPLGASPLQPTVGTRTPPCTARGRWHPLHPHAGPPRWAPRATL